MKKIFLEILKMVINFFKPYGLKDEKIKIPKELKRMGFKTASLNLLMTIITLSFAFLLKFANMMIESRMILLGIILFMLYRGQYVIREGFRLLEDTEKEKFNLLFDNEILLIGSEIVGKTTNKVLKYDKNEKVYKIMTNESIINGIKNYLNKYWSLCIYHVFDGLKIISTLLMLVVAILTNNVIPQKIFIPLISIFSLFSFFSSAYITLNRKEYYKKNKEHRNQQSVIINDMLRVPVIVNKDLDMRISKFKNSINNSNENIIKFNLKVKKSRLFDTIIETLSHYVVIIFYLLSIEWNSINLATFTEIAATLAIVETAISYISKIAYSFNNHSEMLTVIQEEEKDISLILDVYNIESIKDMTVKSVKDINIKPFTIKYIEESQNDKPFTLTSENSININNGEIVVLYGPSGSGKSTFMKMITDRIRIEKTTEIPSTSRFMFYDEKLKFGSLSIFEELFCCDENPNLYKMQNILENLHLWNEIKSNCFEVWQWMKEKKFDYALSNGQKQRLILAKMLYWLNDDIDVMVLDECTSGLDDKVESDSADAQKILEYIVRYCNMDKKRIIIISTHQNIDELKENLSNEYIFRNMHFISGDSSNFIKEIN